MAEQSAPPGQPAAAPEKMVLTPEEAMAVAERIPGVTVDRSKLAAAATAHTQREETAKNQAIWDIDAKLMPLLKSPLKNKAEIDELRARRTELEKQRKTS